VTAPAVVRPIPILQTQPAQVPDATWQPAPNDARVLMFPWDVCMPDNNRFVSLLMRTKRGQKKPRQVLSADYRRKKVMARTLAALQWAHRPLLLGDVVLVARCYFPNRIKRDAGNYRKLLTDAMSKAVYTDDAQISDERWQRAGIDRVNPRIEVMLHANKGDVQEEIGL
jgi:Holliday junction resolvase RusA-like endonuclease